MIRNFINAIGITASLAIATNAQEIDLNKSYQIPVAPPEQEQILQQQKPIYLMPARGTVTSGFGQRWGRLHKGIDIAAPIGTPIIAASSGTVTTARWNSGGYGNLVDIQHPDGSVTRYGHNSRLLVSEGQHVEQGQLIALMGSTGHSTGSHLHFEIRQNGIATNPAPLLGTAIASSSATPIPSPRTSPKPLRVIEFAAQNTEAQRRSRQVYPKSRPAATAPDVPELFSF